MELIEILKAVFIGIIWIVFGSFINALEYRLHSWMSQNWRSICPSCKNQLSWWMNIPLFSWLLLKWKCFFCKSKISIQYPLVEVITSLVFVIWYIATRDISAFNSYIWLFALFSFLFWAVLVSLYDFKYMEIPYIWHFFFLIPTVYLWYSYYPWHLEMLKYILMWPLFFIGIDLLFKGYIKLKRYLSWSEDNTDLQDTIGWWDILLWLSLGVIVWIMSNWFTIVAILWAYFIGTLLYIPISMFKLTVKNESGMVEMPFWPNMIIATSLVLLFWDKIFYQLNTISPILFH